MAAIGGPVPDKSWYMLGVSSKYGQLMDEPHSVLNLAHFDTSRNSLCEFMKHAGLCRSKRTLLH